jgi:hypothetical protein
VHRFSDCNEQSASSRFGIGNRLSLPLTRNEGEVCGACFRGQLQPVLVEAGQVGVLERRSGHRSAVSDPGMHGRPQEIEESGQVWRVSQVGIAVKDAVPFAIHKGVDRALQHRVAQKRLGRRKMAPCTRASAPATRVLVVFKSRGPCLHRFLVCGETTAFPLLWCGQAFLVILHRKRTASVWYEWESPKREGSQTSLVAVICANILNPESCAKQFVTASAQNEISMQGCLGIESMSVSH